MFQHDSLKVVEEDVVLDPDSQIVITQFLQDVSQGCCRTFTVGCFLIAAHTIAKDVVQQVTPLLRLYSHGIMVDGFKIAGIKFEADDPGCLAAYSSWNQSIFLADENHRYSSATDQMPTVHNQLCQTRLTFIFLHTGNDIIENYQHVDMQLPFLVVVQLPIQLVKF